MKCFPQIRADFPTLLWDQALEEADEEAINIDYQWLEDA